MSNLYNFNRQKHKVSISTPERKYGGMARKDKSKANWNTNWANNKLYSPWPVSELMVSLSVLWKAWVALRIQSVACAACSLFGAGSVWYWQYSLSNVPNSWHSNILPLHWNSGFNSTLLQGIYPFYTCPASVAFFNLGASFPGFSTLVCLYMQHHIDGAQFCCQLYM